MLGATPATDLALPTSNGRRPVVGRHLHRASEEQQTNRQSVVVFGPQRAAERFEEEEPHPSSTQLAWLQRAPRALAGRRRTRDSWILLARSLEGTKRKGARGHSGVTWPHHPSSPRPAAGPMKTLWSSSSAALFPRLVLNQSGERSLAWLRHHVQRAQSHQSDDAGSKAHCPDSSTWEKPSPVHPPNAGAPSSELSSVAQSTESKQMGQHDGGTTHLHTADSQPNNHCVLTH